MPQHQKSGYQMNAQKKFLKKYVPHFECVLSSFDAVQTNELEYIFC